ncbi:ABC transporter ATP-binding protein [Algirhabdus cladophorae]|uniref:ABC transporter ATP-binding protein n=1 Tax=Algirhabdus cladophorae TaxID=3377108 RepID=UPI003B84AFC3
MIELRNLTKRFIMRGQEKIAIDDVSAIFPSGVAVGLLGRNGAGKSTLLKMISGAMDPTSGEILTTGAISWPVGFAGSFHPDMTGIQNTRFVARIYGVDTDQLVDFVYDFSELGRQFNMPVRSYSSGMRSRLAFGISMGVPFDTYLVDEVTAVGDQAFRDKSNQVFQARLEHAGAIMVSHSIGMLRDNCQAGAVLERGQMEFYDDINDAIDVHLENMRKVRPD